MKTIKKCLALLLCLAVIMALGACGRKTPSGYYEDVDSALENTSELIEGQDNTDNGNTDSEKTKNDSSAKVSNTSEISGKGGKRTSESIWKIKRDVKPSASKSVIKNLNLGGKKLRMLVWNSNYTERDEQIIKAFESKYNCKITVSSVNYESYLGNISTQLAAGKPFDIIKLHRAHFPQVAIANMVQPLENYISNEDLTDTSKKAGIDWDWTLMNASWNNHIYFTLNGMPCALRIIVYNKLLFKQYGLEDPIDLWNKGQWTVATIEKYSAQVSAASNSIHFMDDTVAEVLSGHKFNSTARKNETYYSIEKDGTVKWLGAHSDMYNLRLEERRLKQISNLYEQSTRLDTMINGQAMMHRLELDQLVVSAKSLQASAAFGKNLNNVGVVPLPLYSDGTYQSSGHSGYAASRGCDPTAAIALTVFYGSQSANWDDGTIPAVNSNKNLFYSLYDKMEIPQNYTFLAADGQDLGDILYPMNTEIGKGGDIMRLLESYAPKVKSVLEYSLSKQ